MSKSKSASKSGKSSKSDVLTKVKAAAVVKPAKSAKSKSKELAKQVATKDEKKDKKKKKAKEPTPEPSESEESDSSESSSDSDHDEEVVKPVTGAGSNGVKNATPRKAQDDESGSDDASASDDESDSASSDSEAEVPKTNGTSEKLNNSKTMPATTSDDSDDSDESASDGDSDSDSDESSADEVSVEKPAPQITDNVKTKREENSDDSDSSEESEDEKIDAVKPTKRKAEEGVEQTAKKSRTETGATSQNANLFVGNLSWNVDEAWLREVFGEFGELAGVRLMTDRDTGRSKGFGYIEFVNPDDAATAKAEKTGAELDGRAMNIDFANPRPENSQRQDNRRKSYGDQVSEASDTLFVGNLSFEVGQETVTEAFAPHGTILGIRLPTDRDTGNPKGFGYVTFSSVEEAKVALEAMQGAYIEGRPVRLDFSSPRPQNNDSPARGRGGFGGRGGSRGGRGARGGSFGGRGGRGGRGGSTNRGGFGDFSGRKTNFD